MIALVGNAGQVLGVNERRFHLGKHPANLLQAPDLLGSFRHGLGALRQEFLTGHGRGLLDGAV
jgi:hypothetical protein